MDIRYAAGSARTTTSAARTCPTCCRQSGSTRRRTSSRRRRLSRFRSTAVCLYRGTINPTRASLRSVTAARTSKSSTRIRMPVRRTRCRSADRVSRSARVSRLGARILARESHGEPLPSLLAPSAQHFSPPPRGHPCSEAMGLDSALIAWAICGFPHNSLLQVSTADSRAFFSARRCYLAGTGPLISTFRGVFVL